MDAWLEMLTTPAQAFAARKSMAPIPSPGLGWLMRRRYGGDDRGACRPCGLMLILALIRDLSATRTSAAYSPLP